MSRLLLPNALRDALENVGVPVHKPKGSILFKRGEDSFGMFLVLSGMVHLSPCEDKAPDSLKIAVGPGAVAGLPATVSGQPYRRTAEVCEDSELVFIDRREVLELFRQKPQFCLQAIQTLGEEMAAVQNGIGVLTDQRRSVERRTLHH